VSIDYRVLGPIEVWAGTQRLDIGGARQRRLLGALILAGGRPVSADRLVDVVWSGDPPAGARNSLRTYIARARRVLEIDGDAPLLTDPNGWRLDRPADALDSARFESLLAAARALSADPMAALTSLDEALSLWRDDAFVEFRGEEWCAGEAVRLDELRLAAEEERFEAMLGSGLYDDAIGDIERFTGRHGGRVATVPRLAGVTDGRFDRRRVRQHRSARGVEVAQIDLDRNVLRGCLFPLRLGGGRGVLRRWGCRLGAGVCVRALERLRVDLVGLTG
jgi:DNA-binding SARP family transcriptional activator